MLSSDDRDLQSSLFSLEEPLGLLKELAILGHFFFHFGFAMLREQDSKMTFLDPSSFRFGHLSGRFRS